MTEQERRICGLPTGRDYANGVYGYDNEVLDAASSPWIHDGDIVVEDDAAIEALIARQRTLDAIAEENQSRDRSLGAPALYLTAA